MSKWDKVKLNEVCTVNPPKKQLQPVYENKLVSFIPMSEVSEDGRVNTSIGKLYSEVSSGFTYFAENDVLFAKITPCMENGKGGVARGLINGLGVGSTEFHVLRPNKTVTSDWIYRFLSYSKFRKLAEINMTGSGGQRRVPKAFLENVHIPLPPLNTQKQIAKKLDTAAELLTMRKQQLLEFDDLIKSTFNNMFGDPVTNNGDWELDVLTNVTVKIGSGSTPRGGKESYQHDGISLIRSLNVHNSTFKYDQLAHINDEQAKQLNNVTVHENDVLINITGASVARSCIVPNDILPARVNQHVSIVRLKEGKATPEYINHMFTSDSFQNHLLSIGRAGGATREAITKQQLQDLIIPLPPIELQTQFANIVTKIEEQKSLVKKAIDETQHLFDSLMSEYFE